MGQVQNLSQNPSQKGIDFWILERRDGNILIIVQFFKSDILIQESCLLHIHITIDKLLKLLIEHLQPINMNEILQIL